MKKLAKTINRPIIIIVALISALAVILAKFFMTKNKDGDDEE